MQVHLLLFRQAEIQALISKQKRKRRVVAAAAAAAAAAH